MHIAAYATLQHCSSISKIPKINSFWTSTRSSDHFGTLKDPVLQPLGGVLALCLQLLRDLSHECRTGSLIRSDFGRSLRRCPLVQFVGPLEVSDSGQTVQAGKGAEGANGLKRRPNLEPNAIHHLATVVIKMVHNRHHPRYRGIPKCRHHIYCSCGIEFALLSP